MSVDFRTTVKKNIPRDSRVEAIDRLVASEETKNLAVLVQTGGLAGEFRRRALEGLIDCNATEQLESLADNPAVPDSLRRRAGEVL